MWNMISQDEMYKVLPTASEIFTNERHAFILKYHLSVEVIKSVLRNVVEVQTIDL